MPKDIIGISGANSGTDGVRFYTSYKELCYVVYIQMIERVQNYLML